jgi:hypothetical protein
MAERARELQQCERASEERARASERLRGSSGVRFGGAGRGRTRINGVRRELAHG